MINNSANFRANTFRDYINLFRTNITILAIITAIILIGTTIYAIISPNIYTSSVTLKVHLQVEIFSVRVLEIFQI